MREQAKDVAKLLSHLANENRLLILCALLEGPLTVGELSERVKDITGPALSQHLHRLKEGGLISSEKQGQHVIYSIYDERLRVLIGLLKREYCSL